MLVCLLQFSSNPLWSDNCGNLENNLAYEFGELIQETVRNQDTDNLFSLIEGELESGPRRSFALSKPFSEIFGKNGSNKF